ncbi:MAG: diiron oxygenase [Aeromicrobium sp.]|uniref:AurF N-oxygenase family protein n=1 Tax=Aeromicrobium sp. TaxID=1871063 RepID=UPI0025BCFA3F|nr:diiron oxygenase [Aeromicrobium sp.]MCK5891204.1 diiron oxygenase [Aeromicrobium sp.]MDF1705554.1 diiron oxygenase [Aeromicrobium sp.]
MTVTDAHDLDQTQEALPTLGGAEYAQTLRQLSQASVDRHFDAFIDIPWDHPDFQVDPTDERWILPDGIDPLGSHPWYKGLPVERQIEIGMWRQANIMKVGLQFENILIRGIMQYVFTQPNGSEEYRYLTHEATEECHHTQMFQQGVNRIGVDVPGMPRWMRAVSGLLPLVASRFPVAFFIGVLAGEEPIDHTQKQVLRGSKQLPPVLARIMQIHVAEEARHISFAHAYVMRNGPRLGRVERQIVALLYPVIMRVLGDAILIPPKELRTEMGVPKHVLDELYWNSPQSQEFLAELFSDVRMLAEESGLMTRASRRVWRRLKIDGRSSRYRSEPPAALVDPVAVDAA